MSEIKYLKARLGALRYSLLGERRRRARLKKALRAIRTDISDSREGYFVLLRTIDETARAALAGKGKDGGR